jgi:glycosyltransferase involved in cell wall biosynthesis
MNILYLTNHLNIGGITSYVLTLGSGLKQKGHNIYVASSGGQLLPQFKDLGIVYLPIPIKTKNEVSLKIILSLFKLLSVIKKNDIKLLHSNSRTTQVLGCLLNRFTGIPHISTCHGFFKKRFSRKIFPCWGQKVIAISEQVKEHLIKDFKVEEKNIVVIHNGIDVRKYRVQSTEYRVQKKRDLGLSAGPVVGIVARLSDVKGHIYLIEAMKIVLNTLPNTQLLIVGEGKMKEELKNRVNSGGIQKNVFFIPAVTDTKDVLQVMDLFIMPSLKEGLGLALMEAMALGLAVVGSDVGGIRSLIQDGINGLLAKPADSQDIARAILELLQDNNKRDTLGKEAQNFICRNFSQEKMVAQTEEVYLECLNAKY